MDDTMLQRIAANPVYQELRQKRLSYGWTLTIIMLVIYYGFIVLIAFSPQVLATRIGSGVITWGIPIGFGVIVATIVLTAVYVRRANSEFDALNDRLIQEVTK